MALALFKGGQKFSFRDFLAQMIPPSYETHFSYAKAFLNTGVFANFFPELSTEYGTWHPIDFQCGFSQVFLRDLIPNVKPSEMRFKNHNRIEFDVGFGCGIFVDTESQLRSMQKSSEMNWKNYVSYYGAAEGYVDLKLDNINLFSWVSFVLAEIVDYDITFNHLKMIKHNKVITSKEDIVNDFLAITKHWTKNS